MSIANRIIKNTVWLYARLAITMFISLWTTRLILNSLGAADFGIYNIVGGAISMLGFLNGAMASSTQRFMSYSEGAGDEGRKKEIFNVSLVLHFCVACFFALILIGAGFVFFNGLLNIPDERRYAALAVYACLIVSTCFTVMSTPYDAVMNAHENMKYYAIIGVFESLLKLIVAFICLYSSFDKLIIYAVLMACIPLITLTIMRIYCHRKYEECVVNPLRYVNKSDVKVMTNFAGWNFVGSFAGLVGNYGQGILTNMFFGVVVNAATGIANQLQGMLLAITNNMLKALSPVITKHEGSGNRGQMIKWSLVGCKFSYILLAWVAIPSIIEAECIMTLWLKDVPEWTVVFFQLMLVRTLLELTTVSLGTSLSAVGKIKASNISTFVLLIAPLFIVYILYSIGYSPLSFYYVIIIAVLIGNCIRINLCKKYCGMSFNYYLKECFIPLVLMTIFMLFFGHLPGFFMGPSIIRFAFTTLLSWIGLYFSLYSFVLKDEEKNVIRNGIKKLSDKIGIKAVKII